MTVQDLLDLLKLLIGVAAAGTFMPPLVAVVVQSHWSAQAKGAVALGLSVVVGVAGASVTGQLHGVGLPAAVVVAAGVTEQAYKKYWQSTGLVPWLEMVTNILQSHPDEPDDPGEDPPPDPK